MKKYLMIFAFMAFFFTNCSKEDSTDFTPLMETSSSGTALKASKGNAIDVDPFLRGLFEQSRDHYQAADPYLYVPSNIKDQLKLNYIQESNRLEALGLESYLATLVTDRAINQELADAYLAANNTIKGFEKSKVNASL